MRNRTLNILQWLVAIVAIAISFGTMALGVYNAAMLDDLCVNNPAKVKQLGKRAEYYCEHR